MQNENYPLAQASFAVPSLGYKWRWVKPLTPNCGNVFWQMDIASN